MEKRMSSFRWEVIRLKFQSAPISRDELRKQKLKNRAGPPYPWFLHTRIQTTSDWKHSGGEKRTPESPQNVTCKTKSGFSERVDKNQ